jgi:hypothetical protein
MALLCRAPVSSGTAANGSIVLQNSTAFAGGFGWGVFADAALPMGSRSASTPELDG